MYEANFEFNTNTIEFDSEINTKDIQANLILNITPDRTSQLINDSDFTTNEALNNAVDVLDERIDTIVVDIEAELDTKADKTTVEALSETVSSNYNTLNAAIQNETEARINADNLKQDKLTAGDGIAINGNVISNTRIAEWGNIQGDIEDQTDLVDYIDENGGKIDVIQKNGTTLPITDKTVNITVPTDTSDLTNGAGYITGITSSDVTTALGYTPYSSANPSGYQANVIETIKVNGTALTPSSKAVDITVPAAQVSSDWNSSSGVTQILNKPTIPTVNNSTITITQGGITKGSFTLNQSSGSTIALDAGGGGSTPTYDSTNERITF